MVVLDDNIDISSSSGLTDQRAHMTKDRPTPSDKEHLMRTKKQDRKLIVVLNSILGRFIYIALSFLEYYMRSLKLP